MSDAVHGAGAPPPPREGSDKVPPPPPAIQDIFKKAVSEELAPKPPAKPTPEHNDHVLDLPYAALAAVPPSIYTPLATVIGKEEWAAKGIREDLPLFPDDMEIFLRGPCPIWSGKRALDTHIAVPLFGEIVVVRDGVRTIVPRTLKVIDELVKSTGGVACRYISPILLRPSIDKPAEGRFQWALMTNDILPGTLNQAESFQMARLKEKGYEVPKMADVVTGLLWHYHGSGERLLSDHYTRCEEKAAECRVVVGRFTPEGLDVAQSEGGGGHYLTGIVGIRIFPLKPSY